MSAQENLPCADADEIARFERHARTSELGATEVAAMTVLSVRANGWILSKRFSLVADKDGGERRVESEWERWQRYSGDFALLEKSLAYSQYRLMALSSGGSAGNG